MRTILIALVVLCLTGCGGGASSGNTSDTGDLLTLANYNQIKTGMSREQVEGLIGPGRSPTSGGSSEDLAFATYKWVWSSEDLTDARTVTISYEDGSVTAKSQYGLP